MASGRRRPRLTGRAAVLVLVLAVLVVSYASSMRAYLQQREHISDLKSAIAERETSINELEREKRRW
ncbi:MAG: septum formation initiator family protein, partial [Nocardioides sp.]|nr:septum formation initiator family protein [Nocardioides sp.]